MNTSSLKSFAPTVRRQLIEAVTRKLDYVLTADTPDVRDAGAPVKALRAEADRDRTGLVERAAYTWFNRLAAIRFLDARGWHPFRARVLTPASAEETQPELLKLTRAGSLPQELHDHTDSARLNDLLDGRLPTAIKGADPQGEVYRHLILAVCRFYHATLPFLFERINDETELLLPDDLLTAASVAEGFRTEITDADCADVEALGWLYQFYISEKKDTVMARNAAVPKEDIPAVTQLFTPHWIVRYLVENSLGRLWLLNRPQSRLREHMPYYIEGESETDFLKIEKAEEIRLLDPACGSGHMLTYAFDLLVKIYEEEGHAPSQIAELILTHNLHGLEICPRAAQLAQFALLCKAREVSRSAFRRAVEPKVLCLEDVRFEENELREYIRALGLGDLFNQPMLKLLHQFEEAKNFGSLIQPCLEERAIAFARRAIEAKDIGGMLFLRETHRKVLRVLEQAEMLAQRYHVVVANPPYMGSGAMHPGLKAFVEGRFPDSKADLSVIFIERISGLTMQGGLTAMVSMHNWMFLASYRDMRRHLLQTATIITMAHFGIGAFTTLNSKVVQTTAFCLLNGISRRAHKPAFFRLVSGNEEEKDAALRSKSHPYSLLSQGDFEDIPSSPVAYWATRKVVEAFCKGTPVGDHFFSDGLTKTGNNTKYLRKWWEVSRCVAADFDRYRICVKGGDVRKYFGNTDTLVDWSPQARRHYREDHVARITPDYLWRAQGLSWTKVTSAQPTFRWFGEGMIAETGGPAIFAKEGAPSNFYLGLAFLSSRVAELLIEMVNPTLNMQTSDILGLPMAKSVSSAVVSATEECVSVARTDWDNFETSWDFRDQPLLRPGMKGATLEASWRNWEAQSIAAIRRMQELETENNRLFIAAYGLEGELQPEVPEEQITLARADRTKDAAALLSYAVGCMMGRYSLDVPGLIMANQGENLEAYSLIHNEKLGWNIPTHENADPEDLLEATTSRCSFLPDWDGIIPVLDGEWFSDDIVTRTREFLKAVWGAATLEQNVAWLEESLGKDLRRYFLRDFYKNHLSNERAYGYKKRPIYWLAASPNGSFQALFYLHRYTRDTVNTLLNRYLREYLHKLDARLRQLAQIELTAATTREKTAARKESDKLRKSQKECQEWEREVVLPLAQQRIELDLDDGVKVNYQKFPGLLAKIPGLEKKEEE